MKAILRFIVPADSNHENQYDQVMRDGKIFVPACDFILNDMVATLLNLFYFSPVVS